jgi:predicted patatin/cPLA2 family phospholipase
MEDEKQDDILPTIIDESTSQTKIIPYKFDTLVLSGASSKGIVTLGALQYGYDFFLLNEVTNYIGTSSGAIICYLLSIGYSPIEIIIYICTNQLMEKLRHFNIVAMMNNLGASSFTSIYEQLEKMTIEKIGYLPTFTDLKDKYKKNLICVTYNYTSNSAEYLSVETTPSMPCLIALRMSANLPLIFEPYKYNRSCYLDGGIIDNFPIEIGKRIGTKILGIYIDTENFIQNDEDDFNVIEYVYKLMFIPITQRIKNKIDDVKSLPNIKIIKLIDQYTKKKSYFDMNINSSEKLDMFSLGYQQCKNFFE